MKTILNELIDEENARRVAEKYILDKYPYANVSFERAGLRTDATQYFYEFAGYSRLAKWPESIAAKRLCEIRVDAHSADIIASHGV